MASGGGGELAIGIDLGTTHSCVAVWKLGRIEIITNDYGHRTTPSCVAFPDADQRLVGDTAKKQIAKKPAHTIFNAKRLIGRRFSDVAVQEEIKLLPFRVTEGPCDIPKIVVNHEDNEQQYTMEEISSMILTKMKQIAEAYIGATVKNAVVTVPAYFNDSQRQATKDAATIAGLNVLRILNEPTAAAIAYGVDNMLGLTGKRNVVVFDLGGGTFDVSVLTIDKVGKFEVKAVAGDTHLGGDDFDNRLVTYCVEKFKRRYEMEISKKIALGRLKRECEKAKRDLSYSNHTSIEIELLQQGIDFSLEITRAKFEELNMSFFTDCIKQLESCLKDASMSKGSIDEVILVGGSTRIPKLQSMLKEFFDGKELCKNINPDEAVAYGAAVLAANLSGQTTKLVKDLVLFDVTPLSLGVETIGELMTVVIPKNTPIPTKKLAEFVTVKKNQSFMNVMVYQGERPKSTDNYLLGSFKITGIRPAPKGEAVVEDCFEIDENGILTITAKVVSTGKTEKLEVTNLSGKLTKEEIQKMIEDAEKFKVEDQKYKRKAEACNELEDCLNQLKKKIKSNEIPSKEVKNIRCKIDDTMDWLANSRVADVDEIEDHLEFIREILSQN